MNDLSKDAVNHLAVGEAGAGQRVDNFLLRVLKGVPKSHIYRILRSGEVRLNRKRVKPDARLALGDELRIPPIRTGIEAPTRLPTARPIALSILYEDDALIAIDKPSGLAVHGGSGIAFGLIEQLRATRPEAKFLELVHRLDRDTSGVLLVAKKRTALTVLHEMMRERAMDKRYLAGVSGRFRNERQRVRVSLAKHVNSAGEKRVSVSEDGQEAETVLRLVERGPEFSLLEAELLTGRTHQIRVHLAHLGHPVLGDDKYGDYELKIGRAHV